MYLLYTWTKRFHATVSRGTLDPNEIEVFSGTIFVDFDTETLDRLTKASDFGLTLSRNAFKFNATCLCYVKLRKHRRKC